MAIRVKITRMLPLYPRGVFLQWDVQNVTESGTYLFDVYRGGGPEGPWELLVAGAVNTYNYVDRFPSDATATENDRNQLSLARGIFYRVVVTPPSGVAGQASVSQLVEPMLTGRQRLLKRKMLRDVAIGLSKLNGAPVALCKRMHWGPRCTKCYDKYTKDVVRANCTTCMGTGFVPGYHTPVLSMARRTPTAVETAMTPEGKADINIVQVWMIDAPRAEEDDVLVFLHDGRRFLVKKVLPTELRTVAVHQKLIVSELPRSSVEFRLVVDAKHIPPLF
jgi:hypothetical protein